MSCLETDRGKGEAVVTSGLTLLRGAGELIEDGWCTGADARAADGAAVEPWNESAVAWSVLGALVAVLEREAQVRGELPLDELAAALYAIAGVVEVDLLEAWNDAPGRTQGEVLDMLARAQARYKPPPSSETLFEPN